MDRISALMDGELDEHQARREIARLGQDEELVRCWHIFHLIGDAMRGEPVLLSQHFSQRLSARLAAEPTVLAPRRRPSARLLAYALSAAASLSAVALVGWVALSGVGPAPRTEVAKASAPAPTPTPVAAPQIPAPPDTHPIQPSGLSSEGKMNEYLIAHQEFSPSTAIQGLAPYIRSVSSAQPARGR
ncbi:MAG TPA: sigma-E factor negative regulatory protein [Burkholderiales bacterium]|nr:sigma-E factor negative regulatory protein [Burkholderiales bacterium]